MGFGVWVLGFGVEGLGLGVWGLGFGFWGLGFRVWNLGFRVWGLVPGVAPPCLQLRRPHFVVWIRVPPDVGRELLALIVLHLALTVLCMQESGIDYLICVQTWP